MVIFASYYPWRLVVRDKGASGSEDDLVGDSLRAWVVHLGLLDSLE